MNADYYMATNNLLDKDPQRDRNADVRRNADNVQRDQSRRLRRGEQIGCLRWREGDNERVR